MYPELERWLISYQHGVPTVRRVRGTRQGAIFRPLVEYNAPLVMYADTYADPLDCVDAAVNTYRRELEQSIRWRP